MAQTSACGFSRPSRGLHLNAGGKRTAVRNGRSYLLNAMAFPGRRSYSPMDSAARECATPPAWGRGRTRAGRTRVLLVRSASAPSPAPPAASTARQELSRENLTRHAGEQYEAGTVLIPKEGGRCPTRQAVHDVAFRGGSGPLPPSCSWSRSPPAFAPFPSFHRPRPTPSSPSQHHAIAHSTSF